MAAAEMELYQQLVVLARRCVLPPPPAPDVSLVFSKAGRAETDVSPSSGSPPGALQRAGRPDGWRGLASWWSIGRSESGQAVPLFKLPTSQEEVVVKDLQTPGSATAKVVEVVSALPPVYVPTCVVLHGAVTPVSSMETLLSGSGTSFP